MGLFMLEAVQSASLSTVMSWVWGVQGLCRQIQGLLCALQ